MILTCGEALIDMLPRESTQGEAAFAPYPGGAVFNTAIGLGRLGIDTQFLCGMSSDFLGDILRDALDASGVDHSPSPKLVAPCTVAFVKLVDGQATYAFYDENSAMRTLTVAPAIEADALFFGGISLVGDGCGDTFEALMLREAPSRVTMIDPNIRPSFIRDVVAYRARIERMMAAADVIKLSDEDLHWFEGEGSLADLARGLVAKGAKLVCITDLRRATKSSSSDRMPASMGGSSKVLIISLKMRCARSAVQTAPDSSQASKLRQSLTKGE